MDNHCDPDLDPKSDLNVDALSLFQRFRQKADIAAVEALLDQEFVRHVRLCELAILHAASAGMYWCGLPRHSIQDFDIWAVQHFETMGFEVEHHHTAAEQDVTSEVDRSKKITTVVVRSGFTAKWFLAKPIDPAKVSAEWRRREEIEEAHLASTPPQRQSHGAGNEIEYGDAVWAAILDNRHIVEVQRINRRSYLCLFALDGTFRHAERTSVAYGAVFGADIADVEGWQNRAIEIVTSWGTLPPPT